MVGELRQLKRQGPTQEVEQILPSLKLDPITRERPKVFLATDFTPLGLLDLASYGQRAGVADFRVIAISDRGKAPDVQGYDSYEQQTALKRLGHHFSKRIVEEKPHIIGFKIGMDEFEDVSIDIKAAKRISDAIMVVGGPTTTQFPHQVLTRTGADFAFTGEAEASFARFTQIVGKKKINDLTDEDYHKLMGIPGLAFKWGGRIYHNTLPKDAMGKTTLDAGEYSSPTERETLQMKQRPYMPQSAIDFSQDFSLLDGFEKLGPFMSLPVSSGRGCPGFCIFCTSIMGRTHRAKSAETLIADIQKLDNAVSSGSLNAEAQKIWKNVDDPRLKDQEGFELMMLEDDFFIDRDRANEFFRMWKEIQPKLKNKYRLTFQTNPVSLTGGKDEDELWQHIREEKPYLWIGGEAFSDKLLKRWRKRHRSPQMNTVLDRLEPCGMEYTVFQILADHKLPAEDILDNLELTVEQGVKRPHMALQVGSMMGPAAHSQYSHQMVQEGKVAPEEDRRLDEYFVYGMLNVYQGLVEDKITSDLAEMVSGPLGETKGSDDKNPCYETAIRNAAGTLRWWRKRYAGKPKYQAEQARVERLYGRVQQIADRFGADLADKPGDYEPMRAIPKD